RCEGRAEVAAELRGAAAAERHDRDVLDLQRGLRLAERTVLRILFEEALRVVFALLNVGLIERVDSQNRAGRSRRDLPSIELFADVEGVGHREADDGMTRIFERLERAFGLLVGARQTFTDIDEDAIVSVGAR